LGEHLSTQAAAAQRIVQDKETQPSGFPFRFWPWTVNGETAPWYASIHRHPDTISFLIETTEEFALLLGNHRVECPINAVTRRNAAAKERRDRADKSRWVISYGSHHPHGHVAVALHQELSFAGADQVLHPQSTSITTLRVSGLTCASAINPMNAGPAIASGQP